MQCIIGCGFVTHLCRLQIGRIFTFLRCLGVYRLIWVELLCLTVTNPILCVSHVHVHTGACMCVSGYVFVSSCVVSSLI